jgi:hypothetical protein
MTSGDLTPWTQRGVLLLNRVLTVRPGESGSHRNKGWEDVTEQAIRAVVRVEGSPDPRNTSTNLPPSRRYPPRIIVESYNNLSPE